jgi:outer membrane receptor protein involved in Fe transport
MPLSPRLAAGFSALLSLSTGTVEAQRADTTAADTAERRILLPPFIVTGAMIPIRASQAGFAVAVVDSASLARLRPTYAADVLRDLPSTFVEEAVGPGGPTIIRIRGGEEVFTQILMDGVETNQNGGFFDLQGLTLTNVERVEVTRGPQSAVYGSSAMSGVVHFVTRPGTAGPPQLEVSGEGAGAKGPGGGFRTTAAVRGGTAAVRYSAGAGLTYSRGIYDLPHDLWTRDGSVRVDASPLPPLDLTATVRYMNVEAQLPVRDPGTTRVPLDPNARNQNARFVSSIQAAYDATPSWSHRLTLSYLAQDFLYDDQFDDVASTAAYPFFVFDATFRFRSTLSRVRGEYLATHRLDVADGSDLRVSYGAELAQENVTDRTEGDFGDGELGFERGTGAVVAETQLDVLDRATLLAGVRLDKYEDLDAELTPRASGIVHLIPRTWSLRAALGRAYKAPNLQQQYLDNPFIVSNPDLKPETSFSWEVGTTVHLHGGRIVADLGYFHQDFHNLIRAVPDSGSGKAINRNLGRSRAQGIEWSLRYQPNNAWTVGTDGGWITTEVQDNEGLASSEYPVGEPLPFRPTVTFGSFVSYEPTPRFGASLRGSVVGSQVVLSERFSGMRERLDSYFLLGAGGHVLVTPHLEIYTRVDNLFDSKYATAFDRQGVRASATLGLRVTN